MTTFEIPAGLEQESLKALEISRNTGKVRRGTNEVTKVIEREKAKLVYIAQDVQPPEVVAHLPALCDEKKIPFTFVKAKAELGRASGIDVPTAAVAVIDPGKAKKELADVVEKIKGIRADKEPKKEKKADAGKKEEKQEEKPAKKDEKPTEKKEAKKEEKAPVKEEKAEEKHAEKPAKEETPNEEKKPEKPAEAEKKE